MKDFRIVFFAAGKSIGEIVRIGGEIVRETVNQLDRELSGHLANAMMTPGAEAMHWKGCRYHWTKEELTPERSLELAQEIINAA